MKAWTHTADDYDVVVVGSGAAGLAAAVTAAGRGMDVALLEKSTMFGGTSAVSAGTVWIPNWKQDDRAAAVEYLSSMLGGPGLTAEKIEAFVDTAGEATDHLVAAVGLEITPVPAFPDYYQERPGASFGRAAHPGLFDTTALGELAGALRGDGLLPYTNAELKTLGFGWAEFPAAEFEARRAAGIVARGSALTGRLLLGCLRTGVAIFSEAELTGLKQESGGSWLLDVGDDRLTARRAVVLASGGFEWDRSLRERHVGTRLQATCSPVGMNTGAALRLGTALGAATEGLDEAWWAPLLAGGPERDGLVPGTFFRIERMGPGSITVDAGGRRIVNESLDYNSFVRSVLAAREKGDDVGPTALHIVFDHRFLARFGFIGRPATGPFDDLVSAPTVGGLARAIGVDAAGLGATVERFNRFATAGVDEDFGRGESRFEQYYGDDRNPFPNPCLAPLSEPPFHAARLLVGAFGTSGGIRTDASAAVLDELGHRIPGLYAVGNASCQPFAAAYPGAGATLGPGMTFGYRAAMDL